jgi:hypothetical protein
MSCSVCTEKFNKSNRQEVVCKCEFSACRSCIKFYLADKTEETHCMSCKVQWDRKFLSDNFEKSYISKEYKILRENILYERELSMLPATQPEVEKEIEIEKLQKEKSIIAEKILELRRQEDDIDDKIRNIKNNSGKIEKREFIRQCPANNCKGFLSSSLKCPLCEVYACADCKEIKGYTTEEKNAHVCDAAILENVKAMEKDCKACPKCSKMIFKIEGCNQMFCTPQFGGCGAVFDWKTLRIESGAVHNPHFFEWQRQNNNGQVPRNPNDVICGREIDNNFTLMFNNKFKYDKSGHYNKSYIYNEIYNRIQKVAHIRFYALPRFRVTRDDNKDLRIKFMRNIIDDKNFKLTIQKRDKQNQKKNEIYNVLSMYVQCMTDILYRVLHGSDIIQQTYLDEILNLENYTNNCFKTISTNYNCKTYVIDKM